MGLQLNSRRCHAPSGLCECLIADYGVVAQLVEHLHGMQGVVGSSPISSTMIFP